ncbi:uncharacterized protein LOC106656047 isoform X2 [Trichogramma pretiosum]|uniref:uncharacterized protein LOC106656047 isoform X2 n=1 Tax=Trichogramma pretiosum TaxID=7493 RepID=UPI0006C9850C|nr:uncharacterized protein LOC106656047 isoform X2 [Trichogramma pretiosum]
MAIDNPSYFSLRNSDSGSRTFGSLFRRSNKKSSSQQQQQQQQQQLEEQPSSLPPTLASSTTSLSSTISTPTSMNNGQIRCTPVMLTGKQHIPSTSHKGNGSSGSAGNNVSGACQKNMAQSPSSKKSLKNLFRSASLIQDPEKAKKFLNGDPRPEDMAPPSPYLNERHMFGGGSVSRQTGRRSFGLSGGKKKEFAQNAAPASSTSGAGGASLSSFQSSGYSNSNNNNNSNNGNRALVEENDYYSYDRDSECGSEASTLPIDEIEPSRSYYNVPGTLNNLGNNKFSSMSRLKKRQNAALQQRRRRRHSIGTYLDGVDDEGNLKPTTTTTSQNVPDDSVKLAIKQGTRHHHNATSNHGNANARSQYASDNNSSTSNNNTNNNNNSSGNSSMDGRDDVVFVSCKDNEAAALWVNYLTACFEQISRQQGRPPFRLFQVSLEDTLTPNVELRIRASRLQIIIVCPVMMERVAERQDQTQQITRQFSSERVLAMMLGVQDAGLQASHRAAFVAYPTWRKFFAKDQDEGFVGQFFGAAVAILGNGAAAANANGPGKQEKIGFSVHPKKVKLGQNRILALLNEPLHPDDTVTVLVDRCGEALEVSHVKRRNPYTLQFSIPERCLDVSMLVGVRISRNGAPLGLRQIKCESRLRELDQILRAHDNPLEFMCQTFGFNPSDKEQLDNWMVHAFQKNVPPHFNLLSNPPGEMTPVKNHASSEDNPTLLHFSARFGLEKLAWQLLECPGADLACEMRNVNDLTPAELAEQSGHARLANQLRGYMQMNEFTNMYSYLKIMSEGDAATNGNSSECRRPMNEFLAAQDRHLRARNAKPSSSSPMNQHRQLKHQRSEEHHQLDSRETSLSRQEDYCMPRPLSEAYSVPPAARPVTRHFPDYATPPPLPQPNSVNSNNNNKASSASLSSSSSVNNYGSNLTIDGSNAEQQHNSIQGYVQMNPAGSFRSPDSATSTPTTLTSSPLNGDAASSSFHHNHHHHNHHRLDSDQTSTRSSLARSSSSTSSAGLSKSRDSPQDELLEIITDFKNNVFTIAEVERLVENWKNRNDVQQSFKDKQRQLAAMRDEYERIQKRMKDDLKMPTPFDRIRKFFTKGHKKDSKDSTATASSEEASPSKPNESNGNNVNGNNLADRRPVSSLSLHSVSSSSSSGRMSTVSGCSGASLGDSGTHSDTDERRLQHANGDDKASSAGMTNYEIPPAPKPYNGRPHSRLTSTPSRSVVVAGGELDVRPVKSSVPAMDDKEYYIAFPPSGLPVHSFKPNVSSAEEPRTPNCTPVDSVDTVDGPMTGCHPMTMNYANLGPICSPPPGMCVPPFEYVNVSLPGASNTIWEKPSQQQHQPNILTIQPEIHPEPSNLSNIEEMSNDENENVAEDSSPPPLPDSPKILNTDNNDAVGNVDAEQQQDARIDGTTSAEPSTSSGVAASEEIAKNFGVTLKKSGPPVPPRSEFTFITTVLESKDE